MDRLNKLKGHIKEHPADYQAVIAFYKLRSKEIEHQMRQRKIPRLRMIAKCRRMLNGEE